MPELFPTAQLVKRDLAQIMQELSQRCRVSISATDVLPITLETNDTSLEAGINALCAAALRAAAERIKPDLNRTPWLTNEDGYFNETFENMEALGEMNAYCKLLAIADELEGR